MTIKRISMPHLLTLLIGATLLFLLAKPLVTLAGVMHSELRTAMTLSGSEGRTIPADSDSPIRKRSKLVEVNGILSGFHQSVLMDSVVGSSIARPMPQNISPPVRALKVVDLGATESAEVRQSNRSTNGIGITTQDSGALLEQLWPTPWILLGGLVCLLLISGSDYLLRLRRTLKMFREERDHLEQKLRALELQDALAENSTDWMYVKSTDGHYLFSNRAGCTLLGKALNEVLKVDDFALFPPDEAELLSELDRKVIAGNCTASGDIHVTTPQGPRTLHVTKGPMHDSKGIVSGVFGSSRDISARVNAELQLKNSEQRFRDLVNATDGIVWEADARSFQFTFVSEQAERMLGFPADAWTQPGFWAEHLHPEDREQAMAYCASCTSRLEPHDLEYRFISRDGRTVWLHDIVSVVAEGNAPRWLRGIMIDVTEKKRSSELLHKLSLAVEQSPENIIITSLDGRIEYANNAFLDNTGYMLEEILGKNPNILQSGKTPQETYQSMWTSLTEGKSWKGEFYNRRKDGSEYVGFAIIAPIRQSDEQITHYVAVLEDVTEKKQIGKELDKHRNHLEELVVSRTGQLEEALQKAEIATKAKSDFLANVSHEIRTPMNAIVGLTHSLRRTKTTPEQAEKLGKIGLAADHLLAIINDVLDLSRIEAGELTLEDTDFSLDAIFDHTRAMIAEQARIKGISINLDYKGVPVWLRGDPLRLRQALLNLASNAIKFTSKGTITLRARRIGTSESATDAYSCRLDKRGSNSGFSFSAPDDLLHIRFEVEDSGIGIPAGKLGELFQPFMQIDASTTRKFGGTGIGLAITRLLANKMNGDVGVESEVGRGSIFWFTAELQRGCGLLPNDDTAPNGSQNGIEAEIRRRHRNALLLIAEDNEVNLEIALDLVQAVGLKADTVANGRDAVDRAAAIPYDLILMDIRMPLINGLDATRAIRAQSKGAKTPILAMTANAFDDDRKACKEAGMNDFIAKPVSPQSFYEALLKWLPTKDVKLVAAPLESDAPSQTISEDDLRRRLTAIHGLDVENGLSAMRGNVKKYARLLTLFADGYHQHTERIHDLLMMGQISALESIAHSLRGSAGMLGAQTVSEAAKSLLSALHSDRMDEATRFGAILAEELSRLITGIRRAVASLVESNETPSVILERLPEVLASLEGYLDQGDISASYLAKEESALLRAAFGESAQFLIGRIDAFEYEDAAAELREYRIRASIEPSQTQILAST